MKPVAFALLVLFPSSLAHAQEWPRFRGPNGSGIAEGSRLPARFGPEENLLWKAEVPFGSSSPVLTEKAVVVTGAEAEALFVTAIDRVSGEELWTRAIERDRVQDVYSANDAASPSPVSDGENVYAFFPELGLISLDAKGNERWRHPLGPFVNFYGMSGSPILAGDAVVLLCDQQQNSFIVAVEAATGEERWRKDREGIIECWTTPVVYPSEAPEQVICFGSYLVTSYSIETGEELWRLQGFGYTPVCSPVLSGDRLYVSVPDHAEAGVPDWKTVSADDANGDNRLVRSELSGPMLDHFGWVDVDKDDVITEEEWDAAYDGMNSKGYGLAAIDLAVEGGPAEVWRYKKALPSIATPLLVDGVLYLVRDSGLVTRVAADTGEMISRERLPDVLGENWPSPVAADGKIYVTNNAGQVTVVAAGPEWAVLETNDLGEDCRATPAVGGDSLFVRTLEGVWAFGEVAQRE